MRLKKSRDVETSPHMHMRTDVLNYFLCQQRLTGAKDHRNKSNADRKNELFHIGCFLIWEQEYFINEYVKYSCQQTTEQGQQTAGKNIAKWINVNGNMTQRIWGMNKNQK